MERHATHAAIILGHDINPCDSPQKFVEPINVVSFNFATISSKLLKNWEYASLLSVSLNELVSQLSRCHPYIYNPAEAQQQRHNSGWNRAAQFKIIHAIFLMPIVTHKRFRSTYIAIIQMFTLDIKAFSAALHYVLLYRID